MAQGKPLWDKIQESGTLVCGAMQAYPIVSYAVPGARRYEGYSPAFCRAIAKDLSAPMGRTIDVAWQPTSWATVVLDLHPDRTEADLAAVSGKIVAAATKLGARLRT